VSLVEIRPDRLKDPDGRHMRELLEAISWVERFAALRSLAVHALAIIGALLWIAVALPGRISDHVVHITLAGFAVVAAGALTALAFEAHWHKAQKRCLERSHAKVVDYGDR
jgi:hypothetical protein